MFLFLFPDDDLYVSSLELALKTSLMKGNAKQWLSFMARKILKDHPEIRNIAYKEPAYNSSFNTSYELLCGKNKLVETFFENPLMMILKQSQHHRKKM